MNKPLILLASAVLALTACSQNADKSADTENDSTHAVAETEEKKADASAPVESTDNTGSTNKPEENSPGASSESSNTEQPKSVALSGDSTQSKEMIVLLETLDGIAQEAMTKQGEINQKMQEATSREDDDAISQMTIDLLKKQQKQLESVPLTDTQLVGIRDKLVKSTSIGIEANEEMISIRQPTAEDEQALVTKFTEGRQLSDDAKTELMSLVQAVGK